MYNHSFYRWSTTSKWSQGELEKIRVWFRDYKIPDGKGANAFGLDDKCMDKVLQRNYVITMLYWNVDMRIEEKHWCLIYGISFGLPADIYYTIAFLGEASCPWTDFLCALQEYTMGVIAETNEFYKKLMSGERANDEGLSLK